MLSKFSVKKPYTVVVGLIIVLILGVVSYTSVSRDILPNINLPYVVVASIYPGAPPEVVEAEVTYPVEEALGSVPGIKTMMSTSSEHFSLVILEFNNDVDVNVVFPDIELALKMAALPSDDLFQDPIILKLNPTMLPIMSISTSFEGQTIKESKERMDVILNDIRAVDGVASIEIQGLIKDLAFVSINPDKIGKAIGDYVLNLLNIDFVIPITIKDGIRVALNSLFNYTTERETQEIVIDIINILEDYDDNAIVSVVKSQLKNTNSEAYKMLIEFIEQIKDQTIIFQDQNAEVFNDVLDDIAYKAVLDVLNSQLAFMTTMFNEDLLAQFIFAQDFNMPAGGINEGPINYTVKIGENVKTKEELISLPVVSINYGSMILNYMEEFKTALTVLGLVSPSGEVTVTQAEVDYIAGSIYYYLNTNNNVNEIEERIGSLGYVQRLILYNYFGGLAAEEIEEELGSLANFEKIIIEDMLGANIDTQSAEIALAIESYFRPVNDPYSLITKGIWDTLDQNAKDILGLVFSNKSPQQISSMLTIFFDFASEILGEEAIGSRVDSATSENVYFINFVNVRQSVESLESGAVLPLQLNSIADIYFLDNSSKQFTTLLTRDASGKFVQTSSIQFSINKDPSKSTADISDAVIALLKTHAEDNPDFRYEILYDDGDAIRYLIDNILNNLMYGMLFAVLVLLLFLRDIKPTLVVGASIVISVVATFVMMYFAGITLNIISMGGLTLGIGMLVDNSIVVIENIYRMRAQGKGVYASAVQGAKQVGSAILASTITTVCVFVPLAFIRGLTAQLFTDLALTVSFSLTASLLVALTLVPMAASTFMKKPAKKESKFLTRLKKGYVKRLNFSLNHKFISFILVTVVFAGAIFAAINMRTILMDDMDMGSVVLTCDFDYFKIQEESMTREEANAFAIDLIIENVKKYNTIKSVGIGPPSGITLGGFTLGGEGVRANLMMVPDKERDLTAMEIGEQLKDSILQDARGIFGISLSSNDMMDMIGGDSLAIRIRGDDIDQMRDTAISLALELEGINGISRVYDGIENVNDEYRIVVDKTKASQHGLTVAQVFLQINEELNVPGVAHTLRLSNEKGTRDNTDVMIYSSKYDVKTYLKGYHNSSTPDNKFTPIYIINNEYFIVNNTGNPVYIQNNSKYKLILNGDFIPLTKNNNGTFIYSYLEKQNSSEGIKLVNTGIKSFETRENTVFYNTDRANNLDLITFNVKAENLLNPEAPPYTIPLYKLLSDDSFIKNAAGEVIYRTSANPLDTERIPAQLAMQPGYQSISHTNGIKEVVINAYFKEGANTDKVTSDINDYIKNNFNVPVGITIDTSTGNEIITDTFNTLYMVLALAIVLIYLVMVAQFQSIKSPFIIMFTIPLAFSGGILALLVTGFDLSAMAMVGLIILMGVVVNNGIVFVDYANKLIADGVPRRMALLRTGLDRLRPILMTALTTICALSVMALDNSAGGVMLQPMAIATIGGLIYATFLTIFFVPAVYEVFNRKAGQTDRDRALKDKNIDKIDTSEIDDLLDKDKQNFLNNFVKPEERFEVSLQDMKPKAKKEKDKEEIEETLPEVKVSKEPKRNFAVYKAVHYKNSDRKPFKLD